MKQNEPSRLRRRQQLRLQMTSEGETTAPGAVPVASLRSSVSKANRLQQRQRQRLAAQSAQPTDAVTGAGPESAECPNHAHYVAALRNDLSVLHGIEAISAKIEYKRTAITKYEPFISTYREGMYCHRSDVLTLAVLWYFDLGSEDKGLDLGIFLVEQGIHEMPEGFKRRSVPTVIGDCVAKLAAARLKAEQPASDGFHRLLAAMDSDGERWKMHFIVAGQLYALAGRFALRTENDALTAIRYFELADKVNPEGAGVKTDLAKARRLVGTGARRPAEADAPQPAEAEQGEDQTGSPTETGGDR
uniref:Phage small terminase subunit n=1 Tax=Candidatus Kentrum sp. FM TaxID=2126340 RepID=A0A450VLE9_9GAMM|nr:MAG: Phage small terminase subunit [Candidatus Kentron sp. FM]VFJ43634.1 MAG: Phage small terminase subunit [Candidatus Kentron sp. FM]VFK05646.1 MAG: Phage small terminase subunit [Candidatus Kentron sp. FM]